MANQIKVNTQTLRDAASYIQDKNNRLYDTLDQIHNLITRLAGDGDAWDSDAARAIEKKIIAFRGNHFSAYKDEIDNFQRALVNHAERYEIAEGAIESNANAFQE